MAQCCIGGGILRLAVEHISPSALANPLVWLHMRGQIKGISRLHLLILKTISEHNVPRRHIQRSLLLFGHIPLDIGQQF